LNILSILSDPWFWEAVAIIVCLGGLELALWLKDRRTRLEHDEDVQNTLDSILEEIKELNDKSKDETKEEHSNGDNPK